MLLFGLILYLISNVRGAISLAGYGFITNAKVSLWLGIFTLTVYGLVLGYLYKPKK